MLRTTYTYVTLEVTRAAYDEIAGKLRQAGYDHAIDKDGTIDMHGLALIRDPQKYWADGEIPGGDDDV